VKGNSAFNVNGADNIGEHGVMRRFVLIADYATIATIFFPAHSVSMFSFTAKNSLTRFALAKMAIV
jgi:hypothetical protein